MAGTTFGGTYEILRMERQFIGTKVGGHLSLDLGEPIPVCKQCGVEMQFLLQLSWNAPRAEDFRMAVVFMCTGKNSPEFMPCDSSSAKLGGNAVRLVKFVKPIEPAGGSFAHAFGIKWTPRKDVPSIPHAGSMLDADLMEANKEREKFIAEFSYTKLGGSPLWLDAPQAPKCPACGGSTIFAAQFNSQLGYGRFGEHYAVPFGLSGVGYLFLCANQCSSAGGAFLWQSS